MNMGLQRQEAQEPETGGPNLTGIPTQMKLNFERRSGLSFDDVRVHYDSPKPDDFQAYAYTFGTDIYIAPEHRETLPHELGHIIQQKRGIVSHDGMENGVPVSNSPAIEAQAESFGRGGFPAANGCEACRPGRAAPVVMKWPKRFRRRFPAMKARIAAQRDAEWEPGRRRTTAFSTMHSVNRQGPHTHPFIMWEVFDHAFDEADVDLSRLVGTRIIPFPKTARKILNRVACEAGAGDSSAKKLDRYEKRYRRLFRQRRWRDLIEYHPVQTYALFREPTHDEIKGKGERRGAAVEALLTDAELYDVGNERGYVPYKVEKRDRPIKMIANNEESDDLELSADSEFSSSDIEDGYVDDADTDDEYTDDEYTDDEG